MSKEERAAEIRKILDEANPKVCNIPELLVKMGVGTAKRFEIVNNLIGGDGKNLGKYTGRIEPRKYK